MQLLLSGAPVRAHAAKLLLIMRITTVFLLGITITLSARTSAQTLTLKAKDLPFEKVLTEITKQTGYDFFYRAELIAHAKPVTIEVKNTEIKTALDAVFKDQPFTYAITNKTIVVSPKPDLKKDENKPGNNTIPFVPPVDVKGRVVNEKGEPLAGVAVVVKGTRRGTATNDNGEFELKGVSEDAILQFSGINIEAYEAKLNGRSELNFTAKAKISQLQDIEITAVNTGYQTLPKERATGSFVQIDNELINRSVSTDILSRIKGVSSGLFSDKPVGGTTRNDLGLTIRGLSTINSNTKPLIVIDNFAYDGDINNINPNDVESVTILKDAAAASIWGARAGNGVIVITTKKGKYNRPAAISINANTTISQKPNLFYTPVMSTSDYIDLEKFLFDKGYYDSRISSNNYPALTPVMDILIRQRNGSVTTGDAANQINTYRNIDIRDDAKKYLYRSAVNSQYSLSLNGGGDNNQYYVSGGFDKNMTTVSGNDYQRISINANNLYRLLNQKVELFTDLSYFNTITNANGTNAIPFSSGASPMTIYPYAKLADDQGNALTIAQYRQGYTDTALNGKVLSWNYKPLDEIANKSNKISVNEYRINIGLRYKFYRNFSLDTKYQYGKSQNSAQNLQGIELFSTRSYINQFAILNRTTNSIAYPVPIGGILDKSVSDYTYQNFRTQLGYGGIIAKGQELTAFIGTEVRENKNETNSFRFYGYSDSRATYIVPDYVNAYTNNITGGAELIKSGLSIASTVDRYLSYYGNVGYTLFNKYILSGSIRSDGSNIFGVETNQKRIPLWSAGLSWQIDKEKFFVNSILSKLRFRSSFGYQGNVNNGVSAFLTTNSGTFNQYGIPSSTILNPPNPSFRWERSSQLNLAVDFSFKKEILSGTFEYYFKRGSDLIGPSPLAPSTGQTSFSGNVSNMKGNGFDLTLNSIVNFNKVTWGINFLLNYNTNILTNYFLNPASNSTYVAGGINPIVGNPLYSLYSYVFTGLDTLGNPQGRLDGNVSQNYAGIGSKSDLSQLKYEGSLAPKYFGGIRNTFSFDHFSLSFNVTYKMGYVFRRESVSYYSLFTSGYNRGIDYAQRWNKKGDELNTNVPSLIYPISSSLRDEFYRNSEVLIEKGDHIRLQDIQFGYYLTKKDLKSLPFSGVRIYAYVNNVGLLWTANNKGIDPDVIPNGSFQTFPNPRTYAIGIKLDL